MPRTRINAGFTKHFCLFEFYSSHRLRCDFVAYSAYAWNFRCDSCADSFQDIIINSLNGCCHGINGVYCTNDYHVSHASCVISYTNGFEIWYYSKILPYFLVQSCFCKFFTKNCIGFAKCLQAVTGNSSRHLTPRPGPGNRLTVNHFCRKAKFQTTGANFVFEKLFQRLYQFKLQVFRKSSYVVMGFYAFCCFGTAFNNVRVNGSLSQEMNSFQFSCFFFKNADKFTANNFSLFFRVCYVFQFSKETFCSVYIDKVGMKFIAEYLYNAFGFVLRINPWFT